MSPLPASLKNPAQACDLSAHTATTSASSGQEQTTASNSRKGRQVAVTVAVAALLLGVTGCSSDTPTQPDSSPLSDRTTAAEQAPTVATSTTLDKIENLTGGTYKPLNADDVPAPPAGFTEADLAAFADRAVDIMRRGVSPELEGMSQAEAFNYVFANQYQQTTDLARTSTKNAAGNADWAWAWASLFKAQPTEPAKYLDVRWQVDTVPGTLDDGTPAKQLQVVLSAAIQHLVPAVDDAEPDESVEPIVMQRTIIIRGFKPLGGPAWWPGIGVQTNPLFGGKCAPANGSLLTPAKRPSTLEEDLQTLTKFLRKPEKVVAATSDAADLDDYVSRYCET